MSKLYTSFVFRDEESEDEWQFTEAQARAVYEALGRWLQPILDKEAQQFAIDCLLPEELSNPPWRKL